VSENLQYYGKCGFEMTYVTEGNMCSMVTLCLNRNIITGAVLQGDFAFSIIH